MKKLGLLLASILILIATVAIVVSLGLVFDDSAPSSPNPTIAGQVPAAPWSVEGVFVLPEDGPEALIEELDAARSSISIEVYLLTDDSVLGSFHKPMQAFQIPYLFGSSMAAWEFVNTPAVREMTEDMRNWMWPL